MGRPLAIRFREIADHTEADTVDGVAGPDEEAVGRAVVPRVAAPGAAIPRAAAQQPK